MTTLAPTTRRRWLTLLALVAAAEAIFALPFVMARVFRPTFLDAFGLTNLEYGSALAVYGVVALVAYAAGGPIADRLPEHGLPLGRSGAAGVVQVDLVMRAVGDEAVRRKELLVQACQGGRLVLVGAEVHDLGATTLDLILGTSTIDGD